METLKRVFQSDNPVFIAFLTAGFPSISKTVEIVLAMEKNGVDVVELGFPFSDPLADGPIIQYANKVSLQNGLTMQKYFDIVREIRKHSDIPILMMTYYNVVLQQGINKICEELNKVKMNGFLIVDLPFDDVQFVKSCNEHNLTFIPFISPSTPGERMKKLLNSATTFSYVISRLGVTGSETQIDEANLKSYLENIRKYSSAPIAVGFGVKTGEQFKTISKYSEGVVIGSEIISLIRDSRDPVVSISNYCKSISECKVPRKLELSVKSELKTDFSLESGRYGDYGGAYIPEVLHYCLNELAAEFNDIRNDKSFWTDFKSLYSYIGRPTPLYKASRLTEYAKGANIWLKREDLTHTGSHKINNAIGQALLAIRLGKTRIIAETGAGQHGVATATVCAKLGLKCIVYMGQEDTIRQELNVFRMRTLGATVIPVTSGSRTLKDAINEAMRDWVTNVEDTHYLVGSAIGPHPFPEIVKEFQSVIGKETRQQLNEEVGVLPNAIVACVGGGSNSIGMFAPFLPINSVNLYGIEAAGSGLEGGKHSAPLSCGKPGVLHGTKTYLMQDFDGQIIETHSISAGLDYPGVGPEHAHLKDSGRVIYLSATDEECLKGFHLLSRLEGIIPALETSHAVYSAIEIAKTMNKNDHLVICLSGRGDKDVGTVMKLQKQQ
eukprot:NODE_325_length_10950_cov_0.271864.p2 type:complete len:665 gc:universal NODE_325_length_10950_cov_0.271864:10609-8615(-)